jgi:hypothetical protein
MKNAIVKSFLKDFQFKFEILDQSEELIFEEFINYCILNNHVIDSEKNFQELDTGTAKAFDGIAIIVNNRLIITEEDLNTLIHQNHILSVEFIFVQSKTSEGFKDADVAYFFTNVENFICNENCTIPEIAKFWDIKNIIFENSHLFRKENPKCTLYYATTSPTTNISDDITETIEREISKLKDTGLLSEEIIFNPLGVKQIQKLYRKIDSDLEATFRFPKNVTYTYDGEEIQSAYFGLVEINEYIKLLIDEETKGVKNVFDDNIRDFLGLDGNEVNSNMFNRLTSDSSQLFGVLNNGITIVADEIKPVGEKFTLHNYQIVNGCQTSNVIFEAYKDLVEKNISIPLKIIATTDEITKNEIVKATNSQTGLKPEQLDALNTFHKMLEEYYKSQQNPNAIISLHYERRSNQYRKDAIPQTKIINVSKQIKTVASMFLDNPHGVSGHYGTVAKKVKDLIFREDDKLEPYLVSSIMFYQIDLFFKKNKCYKMYTKMKWHILMTMRYLIIDDYNREKSQTLNFSVKLNSNDAQKFSTYTLSKSEDYINDKINQAITLILQVVDKEALDLDDRKLFERKETTEKLITHLNTKLEE